MLPRYILRWMAEKVYISYDLNRYALLVNTERRDTATRSVIAIESYHGTIYLPRRPSGHDQKPDLVDESVGASADGVRSRSSIRGI